MAEAGSDTPAAGGDTAAARVSAPKDKRCPYCGQAFTSSSLGRHLDLYIKDKNPKPPDGVHDIEAIRKMRGSITRRQARSSRATSSGREYGAFSPAGPTPTPASRTLNVDTSVGGRGRPAMTEAEWQASRGPHNFPPTPHEPGSRPSSRREASRSYPARSSLDQRQRIREAMDHGHAAELALQEVLGSIKAASARATAPSSPFDFDPFACTFPALVLICLSPPPTLFSTEPFPALDSWSTDAPGPMQYEALVRFFRRTYEQRRAEQVAAEARPSKTSTLKDIVEGLDQRERSVQAEVLQQLEKEVEQVLQHLSDAFHHWEQLSERQRQDAWRLELLRAYSREQGQRKELATQLELARQEVEHLKNQVDRLSSHQQPREFLFEPPATLPISTEMLKQIKRGNSASLSTWDYDRLLAKWKTVVQECRPAAGMSGQRSLPSTSRDYLYTLGRRDSYSNELPTSHPRRDPDMMDTDEPTRPRRASDPTVVRTEAAEDDRASEHRRARDRPSETARSTETSTDQTESKSDETTSRPGSGSRSVAYLWT